MKKETIDEFRQNYFTKIQHGDKLQSGHYKMLFEILIT